MAEESGRKPSSQVSRQEEEIISPGRKVFAADRGGWRILLLLSLIYLSDYADRYVVSSMLQFIKSDWKISDAQAGWLMGIVLLFITLFSLPAAVLVDRWSRRKMIALMTGLWSLATLACAFARSYPQLLLARAFVGVGEAGYAPAGTALLAAAYPAEKRARVMGIWNAAIPLGVGLGMIAGGQIAKRWGWEHAFGLVSLPGFLLALAAWFLPDYQTISTSAAHPLRDYLVLARSLSRIPSLLFTYLGFAMNVAVTTSLMHWLPSYFERTGIAAPGTGGTAALPLFALVLVGAPLGGFLSDLWAGKRREARLLFPSLTSLLAAGFLFLSFLFPGSRLQLAALAAYGVLITCFIAPAAAVTQDVVHPGLRAVSYALCVIVQHLAGDIWSPPAVGWLSDRLDSGLAGALLIVPLWGLLAAVFFRLAAVFYLRDLGRAAQVEIQVEEKRI